MGPTMLWLQADSLTPAIQSRNLVGTCALVLLDIFLHEFLPEPVVRIRVRVVCFSLNEAKGRVEAASLNEVGASVQPERTDAHFQGIAFQFRHQQTPQAASTCRRFNEDSGHFSDGVRANSHSCAAEHRDPLAGEQQNPRGCDEVAIGVSGFSAVNFLTCGGTSMVPANKVLVVPSRHILGFGGDRRDGRDNDRQGGEHASQITSRQRGAGQGRDGRFRAFP
jgi:hypothetical protein